MQISKNICSWKKIYNIENENDIVPSSQSITTNYHFSKHPTAILLFGVRTLKGLPTRFNADPQTAKGFNNNETSPLIFLFVQTFKSLRITSQA